MNISLQDLAKRLIEWADNNEMIDQYYTDHGKDCLLAADKLLKMDADRKAKVSK